MAKANDVYSSMMKADSGDNEITYGIDGSAHSLYKKANNTIATATTAAEI